MDQPQIIIPTGSSFAKGSGAPPPVAPMVQPMPMDMMQQFAMRPMGMPGGPVVVPPPVPQAPTPVSSILSAGEALKQSQDACRAIEAALGRSVASAREEATRILSAARDKDKAAGVG